MRFETDLVNYCPAPGDAFDPSSTPIYQTATFRQASPTENGAYDYTRSGNPTRSVLEQLVARLERGHDAAAFASGMAAVAAVGSLLTPGDTVIACCDLYGGTHRFLTQVLGRGGIHIEFVDTSRNDVVRAACKTKPRLLWIETPTNPLQSVTDLRATADVARTNGVILAVDNSLATPYLQRPLALGAHLVVHSATKFLSGHGDLTAGLVVSGTPELAERIRFHQNAVGAGLSPFESWLLLRGLKTLAVRIDRQQATAVRLARLLAEHPTVERVHHLSLDDHPGRDIHDGQASGPGSVISFQTATREQAIRVVQACRLFSTTVSFGSVGSSISLPRSMSHASIPAGEPVARFDDRLVRLSAGLEHSDDLARDLGQALDAATQQDSQAAYSCSATVGSTRLARRAGM